MFIISEIVVGKYGNFYRPKRSFGQGNIFTPVCHSVHRGGLARRTPRQVPPPGPGTHPLGPGTPPGRYPPETRYTLSDQVHPLRTRYTPRAGTSPPDQVHTPPQDQVPPQAGTPPDQVHPPWTRYTPHTRYTPPGRYPPGPGTCPRDQVHPPGPGIPLDQVHPPGAANSGIRSTIGRYASYWNAFLLGICLRKTLICKHASINKKRKFLRNVTKTIEFFHCGYISLIKLKPCSHQASTAIIQ